MATTIRMTRPTQLFTGRPLQDDEIRQYAPAIFSATSGPGVSARYGHIQTSEVITALRREGFEVFEVRQTRSRTDAGLEVAKHLVRLRHRSRFELLSSASEIPEVVLLNAHDGSSQYRGMEGLFRTLCANGIIAGDVGTDITVRHSGDVVRRVVEASHTVLENTARTLEHVDHFKSITLLPREREALAEAALQLRWPGEPGGSVLGESLGEVVSFAEATSLAPISPQAVLAPRRDADARSDLWSTFNVIQENLLRGGIQGRSPGSRRGHMTTRPVGGVTENVRMNRALWVLAARMAELKAA